ncbi:MAG: TIGR04282 family arsenosugar biosynthesis glycosyltransferase [Candidatus Binataceae bacterium]
MRPSIIIFAREPVRHDAKRRLIPRLGASATAALAGAFIDDALTKAARLSPQRLVIAGASSSGAATASKYFCKLASRFDAEIIDQGGGNLGSRMARALAPYAAGGAILIGTDIPTLPPALLRRSITLLGRVRVVLGPSLDGGYYLLGVRGPVPGIFKGIEWGADEVLAHTIALLRRAAIRFTLGPEWYDIDRPDDIDLLCAHLRLLLRSRPNWTDIPCPATARVLTRLGLLETRR